MRRHTLALVLLLALFAAPLAWAQTTTQVTITNTTYNQIIGPPVVASHTNQIRMFAAGQPASDGLAAVAEDADFGLLVSTLEASDQVLDVAVADGPLLPGESVTLSVRTGGRYGRISAVGMLVTTNDAFFGLDNYRVTGANRVTTLEVPAYDSGTEANSETCATIPGPPCGNPFVRDTDGAEGFVHIHRGFHGVGDLEASRYDWRNPVAEISILRENP